MEDAGPSNSAADFDLMDEFLSGDNWIGNPEYLDIFQPSTSSVSSPLGFFPAFEPGNNSSHPVLEEIGNQEDAERENNLDLARRIPDNALRLCELSNDRLVHSMTPSIPLEDRLRLALNYMRLSQREGDVLFQVWMPTRMGNRQVLTTYGKPFWYDPNCQSLEKYRLVSREYEFSAKENSEVAMGLPGRVFLGGMPEWTPDVKYFSITEYPRVKHAQNYNVSGTIALPIFERDSKFCVGVVEVVSTTPKTNFHSDLENICNALQAVDLTSTSVLNAPCVKERNDSHQAALLEILNVLRAVCETHDLPLAQTWMSCVQQGKQGSRHSEENYCNCVSTVDAACCVNDTAVLGFHQACSEHHLFKGQGVVGEAFTTNQPRFLPDITSIIKEKYPLSHYAKFFHLRAAVAIRLRSIYSGNADFVLEFFLPINCVDNEEQLSMLHSLSITIQQVCQSLRVVTARELEDEDVIQPNESLPSACLFDGHISGGGQKSDGGIFLPVISPTVPSWIERVMEAPEKEASSMLPSSMEFSQQGFEELSVTTKWDPQEDLLPHRNISSKLNHLRQNVGKDANDHMNSLSSEPNFSNTSKVTEKRRAKIEKTVSLQVLRQYFAGSLKDAAKSLGVCPTTLKRICRQHGITRWPSRKIKKVGHSLKKLQVVIDSVQGAEGTFQFSSLYENFTKSSVPNKKLSGSNTLSTLEPTGHPESPKALQQEEGRSNFQPSNSNSVSSSSSHSSSSCLGCSSGSKQDMHAPDIVIKREVAIEEKHNHNLKRTYSNIELQFSTPEPPEYLARSVSHEDFAKYLSSENPSQPHTETGLLKVKAIYGEEKVRFRLQPKWDFQELKQEIAKRFSISDLSLVDLKYLDDDSEWVLLTCDADLEECIDVYNSSSVGTIRISVHRVALPVTRASF